MLRKFLMIAVLTLSFATTAPAADFSEGKKAYDAKDWKNAILNLRPLVEAGDDNAAVLLGNMYLEGYGVAQDPSEAFTLYRKAALKNNKDGILATATLYQGGLGIAPHLKYAMEWFHRGARIGCQPCAFFYGVHLYQGSKSPLFDLKPDHPAAYKWLGIAARGVGNAGIAQAAQAMAVNLAKKLPPETVKTVDAEVTAWKAEDPATLGPPPEEAAAKTSEEPKKP